MFVIFKYSKNCTLTVCFILLYGLIAGQKSDSLIGVLKTAKSDTNKVLLLNRIVASYMYSEPTKGKPFAEQALELAQKLNYTIGVANSYYYVGVINALSGNTKEAELNYTNGLKIFVQIKNTKGQASTLGQIGSLYLAKEEFAKALEYRLMALRLYEKSKDKVNEAVALTNIAIIYARTEQCKDAENYFNKAIAIKKEIGDERGASIIYTNLGAMFYDQQKFDAALLNFKNALAIQEKLGDTRIIVTCKTNIGNIYLHQKKYAEAFALHNDCYETYKNGGDSTGMAKSFISMGVIEQEKGNYKEAIIKYNGAIDFLKNSDSRESMRNAYTGLCQSYIGLKDTKKATEYVEKIFEISETTFSKELSTNMAQLKEKYEAEKREQDILLLKEQNIAANAIAEKSKMRVITVCTFAVITFLILFLIIAVNRNRKKQKEIAFIKIKAELEQTALRAQMNPHFIFNALNSIQHYILNKETEYAYDYLAKFSKLIRQVLINSEQNTITLNKEIETLKLYIELEQRRFKNRFDFEINYADDFTEHDISVPTMLIQPFVENAIWHGIMNLDENKKGKLILSFGLNSKMLKIGIEDNGIGRKEAALRKVNNEYKSVGVLFTQKRLELLKAVTKQQTEIIITDLTDNKGNAAGTKVEILIEITA